MPPPSHLNGTGLETKGRMEVGEDPFLLRVPYKPLEKCCIPFPWCRAQWVWRSEWQRAQLLSNDPFLQEPVSGLQQTTIRSEGGDNFLRFLASACFYISCLLPLTLPRPLQGFHLLTAFQSLCEGDTTWCQVQVVRMMILFREQGKQCIVSAVFLISLNDILLLNNGKLLFPDRINSIYRL